MKRLWLIFLSLALTLLLCACPDINEDADSPGQENGKEQDEGNNPEGAGKQEPEEKEEDQIPLIKTNVGTTKNFWALNIGTNYYYYLNAVLLAESNECLVYAESNAAGQTAVETAQAEAIAQEYSKNIEPKITDAFGEIYHITAENKVTFLLLDIKDGYNPANGGGYVAGYFSPDDMEGGYSSNKRDMLYIDINPGLMDMNVLYSTMAHELQHLINYSNTILKNRNEQDLWINEGLSTAAEYIYGGDPAGRVTMYNEDYGGTIAYGNNFFVWYGIWELDSSIGDSLANYSTAYLFFQWLRLHANNGAGIYKDIINSQYTDYRAVAGAARNQIPALGLSGSFKNDWETLLRTWMLANAAQAPSGLFGYQNKIGEITRGNEGKLKTTYFTGTAKYEWEFYPGEGIFTLIDTSPYEPPAGSGPHIRYVGFGSGEIDRTSPYEGQYLLTFNANEDNTALYPSGYVLMPGEPGYLAGLLKAPSGKKTFGGIQPVRENTGGTARPFSYPVDAGFLREKQKWGEKGPASPREE
jgi:hypothetical protein